MTGQRHRVTASIVIPTRNRARLLEDTLDALASQTFRDFEVVVAVDGSDPDSLALAERYNGGFAIRWVITDDSMGQAAARNSGATMAVGDLLIFLDDDVHVAPDWLACHVEGRHDRARLVTLGQVVQVYEAPPRSFRDAMLRDVHTVRLHDLDALLASGDRDRMEPFVWVGLNTSIRRTDFAEAGGFDERFRAMNEDRELGGRLFARGFEFSYVPNAVVTHRSTKDFAAGLVRDMFVTGAAEFARARDRGQCLQAGSLLLSMNAGTARRRFAHRALWRWPRAASAAASLAGTLSEFTRSRRLARVWLTLAAEAEYWRGARSQGATRPGLSALAGRRRTSP